MKYTKDGLRDGALAISPLLVGIVPFGLIFGITAAAASLDNFTGWATSWIIAAGAAQLATVELLSDAAPAFIIVLTGLVINARHLMYSAAMAPHLQGLSLGKRALLSYVLTDQIFAISVSRFARETSLAYRASFMLGAEVVIWSTWQASTAVGVLAGAVIPESLGLEFAIPLVFLALLVPAMQTRGDRIAAAVAGIAAAFGLLLPLNLGLPLGALVGIVAGVFWGRDSVEASS